MTLRISLALAISIAAHGMARADDPVLAPGQDPGGVAVAVLADGFDTTRADLARVLARDGEGEAIAWDAVDRDPRPFAAQGAGTDIVLAATARGGVRIVAVRVTPSEAGSLAQGIAFAAATPARIVLVTLDGEGKTGLAVIEAAARRFEALLLVGSVTKLGADDKKMGEGVPNLVLLDAGGDGRAGAETIARALGCGQGALAGETGAELKTAFLARLESEAPSRCAPHDEAPKGEQR